jgi:hypothetical protein
MAPTFLPCFVLDILLVVSFVEKVAGKHDVVHTQPKGIYVR